MEYSDKKIGETISVGIDFIRLLVGGETIVSSVVSASVLSGSDSAPEGLVSGASSVDGSTVWQYLHGGIPGVYYTLEFTVITDAVPPHQYIERATIQVIA